MSWLAWTMIGYGVGAIVTLAVNLWDMVFISNPLVIARNALLWPVFLPVLIAIRVIECG